VITPEVKEKPWNKAGGSSGELFSLKPNSALFVRDFTLSLLEDLFTLLCLI
jgi:hypothetical protein